VLHLTPHASNQHTVECRSELRRCECRLDLPRTIGGGSHGLRLGDCEPLDSPSQFVGKRRSLLHET
jgi:hypothetical protein